MKFFDFVDLIRDTETVVNYLREKGALQSRRTCENCGRAMTVQKLTRAIDGLCFRCPKCKSQRSIRSSSFIETLKLPLPTIAAMIYFLNLETLAKHIAEILDLDEHTVLDFAAMMREEKGKYLLATGEMLGGDGIRVQVYYHFDFLDR
jgi:transposase-like protein